MTGPSRGDNQERGVEKMQVGYMQLLTATSYNVTYKNSRSYKHIMQGRTYVDVLSLQGQSTVFPWYDSGNLSSQGVIGKGLLRGKDFLKGQKQIAMSDSPYPFFLLRDPHPDRLSLLETASFEWNFQLIVAVGTLEATREDRSPPQMHRYPFFRRSVSNWKFDGTVTRLANANGLRDLILSNSSRVQIVSPWTEEQNGRLAFDQPEVRHLLNSGVPIKANDALNNFPNSEGTNNLWFEQ